MTERQRQKPRDLTTGVMRLRDAGDLLEVDERTLRRYIERGVLPAFRLAGTRSLRVRRSDVDALLTPLAPDRGDER